MDRCHLPRCGPHHERARRGRRFPPKSCLAASKTRACYGTAANPEACLEATDQAALRACSAQTEIQTDRASLQAASGQLPRDVPPRNASQNDDVRIARDNLGFGLLPDLEELRRSYYYLARGNVGRDHLVEHLRKLLG